MSPNKKSSLSPEDRPTIDELLAMEIPEDRVGRLKSVFSIDDPSAGPEVLEWLVRKEARFLSVVYNQLLGGVEIDENRVDLHLRNAIDVHVHGGSDPFQRLQLEDEIGNEFSMAGLRAMVIKTWYTPSASRNALVQRSIDRFCESHGLRATKAFGGITLNYSVGGFNPEAVKKCLGFPGMKFVWFPMIDSRYHRQLIFDDWSGHGLHYLDDKKRLVREAREICRIIAENELVLATGHYSFEDSHALIEQARDLGVERISVVHPSMMHTRHTIEQMKVQASLGAKLELRTKGIVAVPNELEPLYTTQMIREVGADNFVLGSDWGQVDNIPQLVGVRWAVKRLLSFGVTHQEIDQIYKVQPARLLGLPEPLILDEDVPAVAGAGSGKSYLATAVNCPQS